MTDDEILRIVTNDVPGLTPEAREVITMEVKNVGWMLIRSQLQTQGQIPGRPRSGTRKRAARSISRPESGWKIHF
jgi:hypothetical protein